MNKQYVARRERGGLVYAGKLNFISTNLGVGGGGGYGTRMSVKSNDGGGGGYGTRMSVKSNDGGGGLWYKNVSEK